MGAFHSKADDLPGEFPVFPLAGVLLLPRGKLPLNIFEPRYMAMMEDSLAAGRVLGMIQPDPSVPCGCKGPGLFRIGCLGRLSSFSETEDGRFLVTLTGVIRFEVARELPTCRGYRRVAARLDPFVGDLDLTPNPISVTRDALMSGLRAYFGCKGLDANWDAISRMPTDALVTTLCMVCPFAPSEKQALLEAATEDERANALLSLLQMGAFEMTDGPAGRPAS